MILIGKKKRGKFCASVKRGKEKLYVCTSEPDKKRDIYYVAFLVENGIDRGAVYEGKKVKIYEVSDDSVKEEEVEIPEGVEDLEEFLSLKFPHSVPYLIREDVKKLEKRYTEKKSLYLALLFLLLFLVIASGGVFYVYKKDEERKKLERVKRGRKLSEAQKRMIKGGVSLEFIGKLAEVVNNLPELQRIKSVSLSYVSVPARENVDEKLYGEMKVVIESVYPLEGSRKAGEYYIKVEKIKLEGRGYSPFREGEECVLEILKKGGELIQTTPLVFKAEFRKTERAFDFLETLYGCRFYFKRVSMGAVHSFVLEVW